MNSETHGALRGCKFPLQSLFYHLPPLLLNPPPFAQVWRQRVILKPCDSATEFLLPLPTPLSHSLHALLECVLRFFSRKGD